MRPMVVIPSYWSGGATFSGAPAAYDHTTPVDSEAPELDRCLTSLEQVRDLPLVVILVVCPPAQAEPVVERVRGIAAAHPKIKTLIIEQELATQIGSRVAELAPHASGEGISLRGYGAIRNMGLAVASILGHDVVVFLDDDELVIGPDFMDKALYALNQQNRQRLPIIAKTGFFFDEGGSPLADTAKAGPTRRWWTKRIEFNRWMRQALSGTRISRSNSVCGGCMALSARAFMRVSFDPFITRGEDLDYLFNLKLFGYEMWFDNQWAVRHLPPPTADRAGRFMQDVYRWYYEREKLAFAARLKQYNQVTPAALMPYPGPWLTDQLDERVKKTALIRALLTRERRTYWRIWREGREEALRYARESAHRYLQFQSFWPSIMNGLWCDPVLMAVLERS
ncbi:glycosyltransferase family 2 protein [Collinsella sp. AGMB00827]|uniref:Glycosyltransferase family 2 protein n=1 Tax=Collinsella ureilytica TaxID=2869515 RepID=A0ABS7MMF9_9ACTN|nr:glycosyltransferase [Collinsella urealyticum]MBY4797615.1 glycosyltransferase family 2 protein [Collinsella urealyticum]